MNKRRAMDAIWARFDKKGELELTAKTRPLAEKIGAMESVTKSAVNELLRRGLVEKRFGRLRLTELGKDAKRGRVAAAPEPDRPRGGRTEQEQEVYDAYRRREISAEKFHEKLDDAWREKAADRRREQGD